MSTEAAILRTIRETPEDDTARLVYADLVEEEGDPARGEFIRVQIAFANTPETDPERRTLEDREHELLAENEDRWLGVPRDSDGLIRWQFVRGFVDDVSATPSFMLNEGSDLCAVNPVRRWRVQSSQSDMIEDLLDAGRRGWFSRLETLDLSEWYTAVGELERFLTRSDFSRLRELDLTHRPGLDYLPGILERSPFLTQLKSLRVGGRNSYDFDRLDAADLIRALAPTRLTELSASACQLAAEDIRNLLASNCCQELTSLDISDNQIEPDGWDAFRDAPCRLRSLDLSGTQLGTISLGDVLRQNSLSDLRVLNLNHCGSAVANIRALAASRFWTQAEEFRMQNGGIPESSLEPLFTSAGSPNLRVFDVSGNAFEEEISEGLCNAEWGNSLTWLGLSDNHLSEATIHAIAGCQKFAQLRTLNLDNSPSLSGDDDGQHIADAGCQAIAENLVNLRHLDLGGFHLSEIGLGMFLNSPRLQLAGLRLRRSGLGPEAIRLLSQSPALAFLRRLDLSDNSWYFSADSLAPLAESRYLSPLCELDIQESYPDEESLAKLRARLGRRLRA